MRPIAASMVTVDRAKGSAVSRCTWSKSSSPSAANMKPLGTSSTDQDANLGSGRLGGHLPGDEGQGGQGEQVGEVGDGAGAAGGAGGLDRVEEVGGGE